MQKIFEIATNISTPLMLAGFLTAAFFLILRQILNKDLFRKLSIALSADLIRHFVDRLFILSLVALVLGFLGFIFTGVYRPSTNTGTTTPKESDVQMLKHRVLADSQSRGSSPAINEPETASDPNAPSIIQKSCKYGRSCFWPALDYQLKNVGTEIGLVTSVTLDVLQATADRTPDLYFQLVPTPSADLELRIVNLGWGPALRTEVNFLSGPVRTVLSAKQTSFVWHGNIDDQVVLEIAASSILTNKVHEFKPGELLGTVTYYDENERYYNHKIEYDSIPRYRGFMWILVVKPNGFEIKEIDHGMRFSLLYPTGVYDVVLEPKEKPYSIDVPVSQAIPPGEADRFQIVIASPMSAHYIIRAQIEVDGKKLITLNPVSLDIKLPRHFTAFGYRDGLPKNIHEAEPFKMQGWIRKALPEDMQRSSRD